MKSKIAKNFCYEGLGFPVYLDKVKLVEYQGEYHPKVDVQKVSDAVIRELAIQANHLTGMQVKFIRSYFGMSLRDFGELVVHESHAAVNKWEKKGDLPTDMNENTEQVLRLYIIENTCLNTKSNKTKFYDFFQKSKEFFKAEKALDVPLHIANAT